MYLCFFGAAVLSLPWNGAVPEQSRLTVRQLVRQLGDDAFLKREVATKELARRMDFALMKRLGKQKSACKDAEVSRRIDELVANYASKRQTDFAVDLGGYAGYPFIDEGLPAGYRSQEDPWKSWDRDTLVAYYLQRAHQAGAGRNHYEDYRKATEIWMHERISWAFSKAIERARTESEFQRIMRGSMERIQNDIAMLKDGDDRYFRDIGQANPLRKRARVATSK